MNPKIEFCINNIVSGSKDAKEELEKDPDLDVIECGCTSFCGICSQYLFAVVDGEPVMADTTDELVENVYNYIEENLLF